MEHSEKVGPPDCVSYKIVAGWQHSCPVSTCGTVWDLRGLERAPAPGHNTMRAPRFPLQLSVQYRPVGQLEWHTAETANVSASGVLVQASSAPEVDTHLEFRLMLPPRRSAVGQAEVSGRGHVVRQVAPPQGQLRGFALAIDECDFLPVNHFQPA
jgi:PilZ domain